MTSANPIVKLSRQKRLRVAGLMSGTSADGVDVAIVDIDSRSQTTVAFGMVRYPAKLRKTVFELFDPATSHVDTICEANFVLGSFFAKALVRVCQKNNIPIETIDLIGSHGQTIYHDPQGKQVRSSLQIGEPSVIAKQTGITTVADFRPCDMACGGQGAPLVPFADHILFKHRTKQRVIQNIGGIANLTYLPANARADKIIAFDTGPGNMIIDGIVSRLTNRTYDRNGSLAAKGNVCGPLLKEMLTHPYFRKHPPKTCGREAFGTDYCRDLIKKAKAKKIKDADLFATATMFTATTIARAYHRFLPALPDEVILCGGGYKNKTLIRMLGKQLKEIKLLTTNDLGIDADAKEAISFATLAWATIKGIPSNVPSATGAIKSTVLGKIVCAS